jgi:hypothetical protein
MSANGTFVFMKSAKQNADHEPSDLIPIHDGMILSFINYEIRVNLEKRNAKEIDAENQAIMEKSAKFAETASFAKTMKASAPATAVKHEQEPVHVKEEVHHVEETKAHVHAEQEKAHEKEHSPVAVKK